MNVLIYLYVGRKSGKPRGQLRVYSFPNQSSWIDFEKLEESIENMYIFHRPSEFKTAIKVSNVKMSNFLSESEYEKLSQKSKDMKNSTNLFFSSNLSVSRNEPLHVFIDNFSTTYMVLSLSQTGDTTKLIENPNQAILQNDTVNHLSEERLSSTRNESRCLLKSNKNKVPSSILLETYDWSNDKVGPIKLSLNAIGTRSVTRCLNPGRHIFRLWIKSEHLYCITLLSNTTITVGSLQRVWNEMTHESLRFTQFCDHLSNSIGKYYII